MRTARERVLTRITDLAEPAERADAWGGLGMLYHAQNRLGEAAEHYRRALDEAETIHWHYLLSVVLTDQGDVAGAAAGFRRALELAEGRHMLASHCWPMGSTKLRRRLCAVRWAKPRKQRRC